MANITVTVLVSCILRGVGVGGVGGGLAPNRGRQTLSYPITKRSRAAAGPQKPRLEFRFLAGAPSKPPAYGQSRYHLARLRRARIVIEFFACVCACIIIWHRFNKARPPSPAPGAKPQHTCPPPRPLGHIARPHLKPVPHAPSKAASEKYAIYFYFYYYLMLFLRSHPKQQRRVDHGWWQGSRWWQPGRGYALCIAALLRWACAWRGFRLYLLGSTQRRAALLPVLRCRKPVGAPESQQKGLAQHAGQAPQVWR